MMLIQSLIRYLVVIFISYCLRVDGTGWFTDVRIKNAKIDEITIWSTETNLANMYEPFTNCEIGRFMVSPAGDACGIGRKYNTIFKL